MSKKPCTCSETGHYCRGEDGLGELWFCTQRANLNVVRGAMNEYHARSRAFEDFAHQLAETLRLLCFPSRGQCMAVDFEKATKEAEALLARWDEANGKGTVGNTMETPSEDAE